MSRVGWILLARRGVVLLGTLLWVSLAAGCGGETVVETQTECAPVCEIGTATCDGEGVVVECVEGPGGCPAPQVTVCGQDEVCEQGACEARQCPEDACEVGESVCADDATVSLCVEGRDGCGVLVQSACGQGTLCQDGACVGDCVDADGDGFGVGCEAGPDCDDGDGDINPDAQEVCDGVDNNCDEQTDEGFDDLGSQCEVGQGVCAATGSLVCAQDGQGVVCDAVEGQPAQAELCGNDADDDCDGQVDEGFDDLGAQCEAGQGICAATGSLICAEDGLGLVCDAVVGQPDEVELCDGQDNDCDGQTDEDFALGADCEVGIGACAAAGVLACAEDGLATVCQGEPLEPGEAELCGNNIDDDCNGEVDEGFEALGTACDVGDGACGNQGIQVCSQDRTELICGAQEGEPSDEICDGIDNDCNGQIDETFPDKGQRCEAGEGICRRNGDFVCAIDGQGVVCTAVPGEPAAAELCGNNVDDDCDGEVDEGFEALGEACSQGQGQCEADGEQVCSGDLRSLECDAEPGEPGNEFCDGLDNDCDGVIDGPLACGACEEDALEPNDNDEQATALAVGEIIEAQVCFFNRDVYDLGQIDGGVIQVNVLFDGNDANINIGLFRDGVFVPEAQGGVSNVAPEQVVLPIQQPGRYTAHVFVQGGAGAARYQISVNPTTVCLDDVFEPDGGPAVARPLPPGEVANRVACQTTQDALGDWFDLGELAANTLLDINATFSHAQANLDMFLFRMVDGEPELVESAISLDNNEAIETSVQDAGRYFVQVVSQADNARGTYALSYTRQDNVCVDDPFEANEEGDPEEEPDQPANGLVLGPGITVLDRVACPGDDDWHFMNRIYEVGEVIQANAYMDRRQGDLDLELFFLADTNDLNSVRFVTAAATDGETEVIRHTVTERGFYFVRAFAVEGQPTYRLGHMAERLDNCVPDGYEVDDFLVRAVRGEPDRSFSMKACIFRESEEDEVNDFDLMDLGVLAAGTVVDATWTFVHARGDVDARIFNEEGTSVAESLSDDDNEAINFVIPEEGRYFFGTFLLNDDAANDGNDYRVRYTLTEPEE